LVFGVVTSKAVHVHAGGRPSLGFSFADGTSNTILFAEKYAIATIGAADHPAGKSYKGGCHWAYFQADCNNALFAYHDTGPTGQTDPNAIGPTSKDDPRDSRFQVGPPADRCNPCLPSTAHTAMNTAFADGGVRALAAGITPRAWWALVTPAGRDQVER
jgi:hypothetical protein